MKRKLSLKRLQKRILLDCVLFKFKSVNFDGIPVAFYLKTSLKGFSASKCDVGNWIFQNLRNVLRNYLEIFWIFSGILREDFFGGNFWEIFFGRIFWGGFFREDFFGTIFREDFIGRNSLGGITYRVSHIEMVETKWLWWVVELRILMNYGT